jgi:hypothetical protein
MMLRISFLLSLLLLFGASCLSATAQLNFETEELVFTLSDSLLAFDGVFTFSNNSDEGVRRHIIFPIPTDEFQLPCEDASVSWDESSEPIEMQVSEQGLWFGLELSAKSVKQLRITYRQKLKAKRAKYTLLTANAWPKPLAFVHYEVILPPEARITRYPFAEEDVSDYKPGSKIWQYFSFRPTEDFYIEWE